MAATFNLEDYVTVNQRIEEFYTKYPEGSIQSEIVSSIEGEVIFKSSVYRTPDDKRPCVGHARELAGSTFINKGSHIENCETSAVGRALAMMGFEVKKSVASREEVQTARLNQDKEVKKAISKLPIKETTDNKCVCEGCGIEIKENVAMFSTSKYHKKLCFDCQKKVK
jgi:hypothetical protein